MYCAADELIQRCTDTKPCVKLWASYRIHLPGLNSTVPWKKAGLMCLWEKWGLNPQEARLSLILVQRKILLVVNFAEQAEFPLALGAVNKQQALEIVKGLNVRKLKHRRHHKAVSTIKYQPVVIFHCVCPLLPDWLFSLVLFGISLWLLEKDWLLQSMLRSFEVINTWVQMENTKISLGWKVKWI